MHIQAIAIFLLVGLSFSSFIPQASEIVEASNQSTALNVNKPHNITRQQPHSLSRTIASTRSIITYSLCDPFQRAAIVVALIEAIAWCELSIAKVHTSFTQQNLPEQTILQFIFRLPDRIEQLRDTIVRRYQAVIGEVGRWDRGRVKLICATNEWEECYVDHNAYLERGRQRAIDTRVLLNMMIVVSEASL